MRNTVAKKLRKLLDPQNIISRRVYRRVKKRYNEFPKALRPSFLKGLEAAIDAGALDTTRD